jgi:hypothetical protein
MPLQPPEVPHGKTFGATIPAHPELMINMAQAQNLLHRKMPRWSIRSWRSTAGKPACCDYISAKVIFLALAGGMRVKAKTEWTIF